MSICAHVPKCGQWFDTYQQSPVLIIYFALMSLYVPMCPHLANSLTHTYKLWYWLLIVSLCVPMVPCAPMWPMLWYKPINFETGSSFWVHVAVCAHEVDGLIPIYNLRDWFAILRSCDCLWLCAPFCPMFWYHLQLPIYVVHFELIFTYVPMCPMWPMFRDTAITSCACFPLWTCVSLCNLVDLCGQWYNNTHQ